MSRFEFLSCLTPSNEINFMTRFNLKIWKYRVEKNADLFFESTIWKRKIYIITTVIFVYRRCYHFHLISGQFPQEKSSKMSMSTYLWFRFLFIFYYDMDGRNIILERCFKTIWASKQFTQCVSTIFMLKW